MAGTLDSLDWYRANICSTDKDETVMRMWRSFLQCVSNLTVQDVLKVEEGHLVMRRSSDSIDAHQSPLLLAESLYWKLSRNHLDWVDFMATDMWQTSIREREYGDTRVTRDVAVAMI